jgi:hypothetical protein
VLTTFGTAEVQVPALGCWSGVHNRLSRLLVWHRFAAWSSVIVLHANFSIASNNSFVRMGFDTYPSIPAAMYRSSSPLRLANAHSHRQRWRQTALRHRRVGHNELGAIAACRGFIDAQKDYAAVGHDGLSAGIYAQKLMSSPGKQMASIGKPPKTTRRVRPAYSSPTQAPKDIPAKGLAEKLTTITATSIASS